MVPEAEGAGKGLEQQEGLRELGGLILEQRRLRGDLLALQVPARRGEPGGVGLCCQGTRARPRGNGLRLGQGRVRLGLRRNLLLERVGRPWQGLPREVWSAQPWRCPRKAWPWHSVLWAGGQGGDGAQGGSMGWEGFSSLRDPGILWVRCLLLSLLRSDSPSGGISALGLFCGFLSPWKLYSPQIPRGESCTFPGAEQELLCSAPLPASFTPPSPCSGRACEQLIPGDLLSPTPALPDLCHVPLFPPPKLQSWNHWMVWVGGDLPKASRPTPGCGQGHPHPLGTRGALFSLFFSPGFVLLEHFLGSSINCWAFKSLTGFLFGWL
ncbi:uncharacterized protein LOC127463814 [Manacus candei]|uniref:uncharacterized protein LOC127463814 n=1 Tax=Manacus candei TaxID=415023 RepID=UPI002227F41A|nr:uncharacterized protein LOC127463814 [Manacus candei]